MSLETNVARWIAAQLSLHPDEHLLDIGCGTGELTQALAPYCGAVTGIDKDGAAIAEALEAAMPHVHFLQANAIYLQPSVAGPFDKALCFAVFQYMKGYDAEITFLNAMHKVLPTGGQLLMADVPLKNANKEVEVAHEQWDFGEWKSMEHLRSLAQNNGFSDSPISRPTNAMASHNRFDCLLTKQ